VEGPFRPAAGVVLLRSEAEEEAQLRIPAAAVEVRLDLSVEEAYQESLHKVRVRRLCFGVVARVREVAGARPVAVVPPLQPVAPERTHLLQRFDRSAGRLPLRLKTVR
jgi:hypothetical protein